jgi:hypothetical protein
MSKLHHNDFECWTTAHVVAEGADRALHRRRSARGLAHAVARPGAGAVARHHPQCHVGPGRAGPDRSPHTSAGRVPTARGYRLFVDTMLTAQREPTSTPQLPAEQPQRVIANAAQLLSNLSQFVGVVMAPRRTSAFRHIEFLRLSERRLLLIIVVARWRCAKPRAVHRHRLHGSRQLQRPPISSTPIFRA